MTMLTTATATATATDLIRTIDGSEYELHHSVPEPVLHMLDDAERTILSCDKTLTALPQAPGLGDPLWAGRHAVKARREKARQATHTIIAGWGLGQIDSPEARAKILAVVGSHGL